MSSIYIVSSGTDFRVNHNYNKILKSDCLPADGFITFSYKECGLVGVYTNAANWKKLISTVHFSLRIHIFGHATKLRCLYFGFRQSN